MATSLESVYAEFASLWADSKPIRWKQELDAAIQAAGLGYGDVTRQWLAALDPQWVYGEADTPFRDLERSRAYRRYIER